MALTSGTDHPTRVPGVLLWMSWTCVVAFLAAMLIAYLTPSMPHLIGVLMTANAGAFIGALLAGTHLVMSVRRGLRLHFAIAALLTNSVFFFLFRILVPSE
jgi:ABC-type uncharacterized transport system permease subunit